MAAHKVSKKPPDDEGGKLQAPPDWPALVAAQQPAAALAFAMGNFPQLVRHIQPLLHTDKLSELRPKAGQPIPAPGLLTWAAQTAKKKQFPETLLALGALRLAHQFDKADELVAKHRADVPKEWQPAFANEEAALAWHRGRADDALKMWQSQQDSTPVLFNRGMALLFSGKPTEARKPLDAAIAQLPEESAWHHLGKLYLALAERKE
jgi:tetratricopeptide (TPR) repeat protein